jgi:hypothetical protein
MKIAIVGDATRSHAWEQHLMPHNIVREVIMSPSISGINKADACFLIDDSPDNLDTLIKTIQKGLHTFLVARLPLDVKKLEKVARVAEEASVQLQFAHWPSLAPATQLMMSTLSRPTFIHISREISYNQVFESELELENIWVDEVGFCLKFMNSGLHHIEAKHLTLHPGHHLGIQLFMRFENGGTAGIYINSGSGEQYHKRVVTDGTLLMDCDVHNQTVKKGKLNSSNHLTFSKEEFNPAKSAEKAALQFLKAVQLGKEPAFTIHDLLKLSRTTDKIRARIRQF